MSTDPLREELIGLKPKKLPVKNKQVPWQIFSFTFGLYLFSKVMENLTKLPFDIYTVLLIITYFVTYSYKQSNKENNNG